MPQLLWPLLALVGMVVGVLLYRLPLRLFYRHATWLPEDEFLAAFPKKRWVIRAMYGLVPLGFALFVVLMASTGNNNPWVIPLFFFPVFFCCLGVVPAIPELMASASVLVPIGHGSRSPVLYTVSPNASRAAVFRLTMAALIVTGFVWCR
jgi:hypothetical protein